MMRNIYLEGELGTKFGAHMYVHAPTVRDAFKLIEVNNPEFRPYLFDCQEKGIDFAIEVAGEELEYADECFLPLHEGDITVTPIPEGGGGGFKKFLIAEAILVAMSYGMPAPDPGTATIGSGSAGAGAGLPTSLTTYGTGGTQSFMGGLQAFAAQSPLHALAVASTVSLGMTGLNEMMAPDPSVDIDEEQSYLFNGNQQNILEGDPVPLLYGELQVPGQPINFETENSSAGNTNDTTKELAEYGIIPLAPLLANFDGI